jgi:hypothetical protein
MGHSLEWTKHMRNVFVEEVDATGKVGASGWCRVVHCHPLGLKKNHVNRHDQRAHNAVRLNGAA